MSTTLPPAFGGSFSLHSGQQRHPPPDCSGGWEQEAAVVVKDVNATTSLPLKEENPTPHGVHSVYACSMLVHSTKGRKY